MQTTYETLSLMITFGLLIIALLAYLEDRDKTSRKNNCPCLSRTP